MRLPQKLGIVRRDAGLFKTIEMCQAEQFFNFDSFAGIGDGSN